MWKKDKVSGEKNEKSRDLKLEKKNSLTKKKNSRDSTDSRDSLSSLEQVSKSG